MSTTYNLNLNASYTLTYSTFTNLNATLLVHLQNLLLILLNAKTATSTWNFTRLQNAMLTAVNSGNAMSVSDTDYAALLAAFNVASL